MFNADQIDGLDDGFAAEQQLDMGTRPIADLEACFDGIGADISHGGSRASYNVVDNRVQMPPISAFISETHYCATLAHEIVHWTVHGSRLDRFKAFGDPQDYAFEGLVAEIGACFFGAQSGVEPITEESVAYIDRWLGF